MKRGLVALLLCACAPEHEFSPVNVDIAANCNRAENLVTYERLNEGDRPWSAFITAAVDSPGQGSMWALVEHRPGDGTPRLALWHIDGEEVDRQFDLDIVPNQADTVTLLPGASAGEVWVIRETPLEDLGRFDITRIDINAPPGLPPPRARDFGDFPSGLTGAALTCDEDNDGVPEPCDARSWPKHLAVIDGVSFIVTAPTSSPDAITTVFVGRLAPTLDLNEVSELVFTRKCDLDAPLEELAYCTDLNTRTSYPSIEFSAVQTHPNARVWSMSILRTIALEGIVQFREPVVVSIGLKESGAPEGVLRAQSGPEIENLMALPGPPAGLAIDDFNVYVLHATARDGPRLVRVSNLEATFEDLVGAELTDDTRLIQLERDIALGAIDGDTWRVTKLFPDAPERSETTVFEASSPITRVESAGPGSFLVHEESAGPTLLSVACAEVEP